MHKLKEMCSKWYREPISKTKIGLIYGLLGILLLGNLYQMKQIGYSPNELFLQMSLPYQDERDGTYHWLEECFTFLTDLKWKDSFSFLASVTPYHYSIYQDQVARGEIKGYFEQDESTNLTVEDNEIEKQNVIVAATKGDIEDLNNFKDAQYVYDHYMSAPAKMEFGLDMLDKWNLYDLVTQPISFTTTGDGPKVLIFHTHVREEFIGGATVADVGEALKKTLEEEYDIPVLHATDDFYRSSNDTKFPSGDEYETMEPVIQKILDENPSIELVIDLHRDGVNENVHLVTDINGKQTARIMLVNALCLNRNLAGEVEEKTDLPNPYIGDNLALSMQTLLKMNELYPGLSRKIYLNEWRYSTHMRPYSLLIEWGAQTNTSEEAMNAVGPVAEILAKVMQKD